MLVAIFLPVGAALGLAFVFYVERPGHDARRSLGLALLIAAGIYVAFAMASMETTWLVIELVGLILFGVFVLLGRRRAVIWLAAGWTAHTLWDVGLHVVTDAPFVPSWYPVLCVSFDLVIAAHIARSHSAAVKRNRAEVMQ